MKWRVFSSLFFATFLILAFQNCTPTTPFSVGNSGSTVLASLDNGTPYDGKPSDEYARWMRGFTCNGKPSPAAKIEIKGESKFYIENTALQCAWRSREINESEIEKSTFQNIIWGYQDGIYEAGSSPLAPSASPIIPANLVEVWCNDSQKSNQSEAIIYYDETTQRAKIKLYGVSAGSVISQDMTNVSRLISNDSVEVSSPDNNFNLTVHRSQFNSQTPGLFPAEMKFSSREFGEKSISTFCRLGGSLDTKLWPAKQIVDVDVSEIVEAPNRNDFVYSYTRNDFSSALGWGSVLSAITRPLHIPYKARGVGYVDFTDDSSQLVFTADLSADYLVELFLVSLRGLLNDDESPRRISSPLVDPNQSVLSDAKLIRGSNLVLYRDGSQETWGDIEPWLRSVSLFTGQIQQINKEFTNADEEVQSFTFSPTLQKSFYLGGFTKPRLYSVNADGTNHRDATPNLIVNQYLRYGQKIELFGGGKFLQLDTIFYYSSDKQIIVVDLETNRSYPILKNHELYSFDVVSKKAILVDSYTQGKVFFDLSTGATIPIQGLKFLENGKVELSSGAIVLAQKDPTSSVSVDAEIHALMASLGRDLRICQNLAADQFLISTTGDSKKWIVTAINSSQKTAQIAEVDAGLNCLVKNSINLSALDFSKELVQSVVASPDLTRILLAIGNRPASRYVASIVNKLYYASLDGRAPLKVNAGLVESGDITHFKWSQDSKSIFFFGSYRNQSEKRGYLWRVP